MNKKWRKFGKDVQAVSPVVATLMLVLVAAGAAVGLNVWMKGFQEDSTADVAVPKDVQTLSIGGSSTVYEFSLDAIPGFEAFMNARGTPIKVELEKGGSGAGRQAVGHCLVDIGSSSAPIKDSELEIWPDCDGIEGKDQLVELQPFQVAIDAVVFAMLDSNTHCASGHVPALTQDQAYELYYKQARYGAQGTVDTAVADLPSDDLSNASTAVAWRNIPTIDLGTGAVTAPDAGFCGGSGGGGADLNADPVIIFDRLDPGGTSEIATQKLFGQKQAQLEDEGITLDTDDNQGDGNQGVLDAVEDHADGEDALFFTSFGYATDQGLEQAAFGIDNAPIVAADSNVGDETYEGTRPILYITAGNPDPIEQLWLDYVMNPHQNQLIAEAADFISIY